MSDLKLGVFKMSPDVFDVKRATTGSACFDLQAYFGTHTREVKVYDSKNAGMNRVAFKNLPDEEYYVILEPRERMLVPTGLIFDIPTGYSVRLHIRSSVALKKGLVLTNGEGVIDSDYVEQVYMSIHNISNSQVKISHGERLAQAEMVKELEYILTSADSKPVQKTDRNGGFGSTGV